MRKLSSINLVVRKLSLTFAAYSVMNERPKIRKNREFSKFTDMSETKKMTTEEILEIFKGEYDRLLRKCERRVEKYALNMNEDYEYFFRWHGDDMYKAQVNLKAIRGLRPATAWDDLEKSRRGSEVTSRASNSTSSTEVSTRQAQASCTMLPKPLAGWLSRS